MLPSENRVSPYPSAAGVQLFPTIGARHVTAANAIALDEPHPHDIPRLGETPEFGSLLLRLLKLAGWSVHVLPGFAGDGVLVIAHRKGRVIERAARTVAEVAVPIYMSAMQETDG